MDFASIRNILVVKLSSLGDIVHGTPCLRALRRQFPRARIVMAVERRWAPVVRHNPNLDALIESDHRALGWWGRAQEVRRLLARHVQPRFDLAIDLQGLPRSALWVYLSGARIQGGMGRYRPGWIVARPRDLALHSIPECAAVLHELGMAVDRLDPEIALAPPDDEALGRILDDHALPARGFVVVNPFGRCLARRWPLDRYVRLLRRLLEAAGVAVVITGWGAEQRDAQRLCAALASPRAVSLAGKLTLGQALCLYARARVMITGDTGPMHVAAALGTQVVALFGPSWAERNGPWGTGHVVIQKQRPTAHHAFLTDHEQMCMRAIDVDSVYRVVRQIQQRSAA